MMVNPRDRRALRLGAAVALGAFLALRGMPWAWRQAQHALEDLRARTELLARARAEVASAKALEDSAVVIKAKYLALAPKLLTGSSAAAAGADLTSRLAVLAERQRVRLERTDAVPDSALGSSTTGELLRVAVRAAFEGDSRGTFGVLAMLTEEPAVLVVDEVRIVAPEPGSPETAPERVRTELRVSGWYLHREETR